MIVALALAAATPLAARVDAVATGANLAGVILVAKGDTVLVEKGYGSVTPGGTQRHSRDARWRLASITKQVTAALLMRDVGDALDQPMALRPEIRALPGFDTLTLRQLLTHHSGLPNPDDTPEGKDCVPAFYRTADPTFRLCRAPATPGAPFRYNNCDYLIAGSLLAYQNNVSLSLRWPIGMMMAEAGETGVPGFVGGKPEPHYELASYGAAGGLIGTARSVFHFDRALMTGKLLTAAQRDELWKPEGNGSYQALGQWVFPGQLKNCAKPKRIVQRDGEIGGVQTRNFILPDNDLIVVVFTNRSADGFKMGEVWEGSGFVYDLLSTVACA